MCVRKQKIIFFFFLSRCMYSKKVCDTILVMVRVPEAWILLLGLRNGFIRKAICWTEGFSWFFCQIFDIRSIWWFFKMGQTESAANLWKIILNMSKIWHTQQWGKIVLVLPALNLFFGRFRVCIPNIQFGIPDHHYCNFDSYKWL